MIGAIILLVLVGLILLSLPIGLAIALAGVVGYLFAGHFSPIVIGQRMFESLNSFPLVAIPLFITMANLIELGGVTASIVAFATNLFGRLRGALALGNVGASMFFAGVSGSSLADVASVGSVLIPMMKRQGYTATFSGAVTAASAMIGPIIPPSILMILYGAATQTSVIRLFLGGAIPGIILGITFILYSYITCRVQGMGAPTASTARETLTSFGKSLPALVIPVLIIVGISGGVFTVTESAGVAVLYALGYAVVVQRKNPRLGRELLKVLVRSARDTATVAFLIAASGFLAWSLTINQVPQNVAHAVFSISPVPAVNIGLIMVFTLLVGMLLAPAAGLLLVTPLLVPISQQMGMDPVHFGVLLVFALQVGILTPPVAGASYLVARIADVPIDKLFVALVPWIAISVVVMILVAFVPEITLWLPNLLRGGN